MRSRVFVVQRTEHNFVPATNYGDIEFVALANFPKFGDSQKHIDYMKNALRDFTTNDYLLPVGDPLNIGLAMSILSKLGAYTVLKWDNTAAKYIPVNIKEI